MGRLANLDVLSLPGLACLVGESYFRRFAAAMLLPPLLLGLVKAASRLHLRRVRAAMPIPQGLGPLPRLKLKLHRAVVASGVDASYSSLLFAVVYLLYPGIMARRVQCHGGSS